MSRNSSRTSSNNGSRFSGPQFGSNAASRPAARRGPSGAWSRLKPANIDPLEVYGLPSKGEERLHDFKTQELFYKQIIDRYMKFCAASAAPGGEGLDLAFAALSLQQEPPGPTTTNTPSTTTPSAKPAQPHSDLPTILMAMRKLREGILGSRRRDHFAQRAYMLIIQASILSSHWESYVPALAYLLDRICLVTPILPRERLDFTAYRVLDLACRQDDVSGAYVLARREGLLGRDRRVTAVLAALARDDWVGFWKQRNAVDGYLRAIMDCGASTRVRMHALKCLGKAYLSAEKRYVERVAGMEWDGLVRTCGVGWEADEKGTVVIRKVKAK